jgi:hypothetical protein
MNIFTLAFGLPMIGGGIYCLARLLVSLVSGSWKHTLKACGVYLGSLALIVGMLWLGDPYARDPVSPDELVGTYSQSQEANETSGTFTLSKGGIVKAAKIPAYLIQGFDESRHSSTGGLVSFTGRWTVEKSSAVYVVRIEIQDFDLKESAGRSDYPRLVTLHIMRGSPRSLAFSVFDGSDFNDHVYERRDVQ